MQLSIPVEPEKAIKTRHPSEPDPQIFRQYLFPKNSPTADLLDDYDEEIPYPHFEIHQWSKRSIVLISLLLLLFTCILVYLLVSLYRCLCTREYADWRSSWFEKSRSDGKNLEDLVTETLPIKFLAHNQEIEYLCANTSDGIVVTSDLLGNVKVWNILSCDCKHFIQRSHFKEKTSTANPIGQQANSGSSSLGSDTTRSSSPSNEVDGEWSGGDGGLNRSASNGLIHRRSANSFSTDQANQSTNQLNSQSTNQTNNQTTANKPEQRNGGFNFAKYYQKANFSSNFISKFVFNATRSNSFDKIHSNDDLTSHKNHTIISTLKFQPIWTMFRRDKHLFLGCSNGRFEVWNIDRGFLSFSSESPEVGSGITVMTANNNKLAIARLEGFLEIWELELKPNFETNDEIRNRLPRNLQLPTSSGEQPMTAYDYITFRRLEIIKAHKQPITCLKMDNKYLVTGSADHKVRVFKFGQLNCSSEFTLHGHFAGITCLEIDKVSCLD